jgi:hypothetical protein
MSEPTSIKSQVYIPGKGKTKLIRHLTFEMISEWIRLQGFDEYTTNGLIELASKYPTQALPAFRRNFNLMIERVRQKRRQEQQGQVAPVIVEEKKEQPHAEEVQQPESPLQRFQARLRDIEGEDTSDDSGSED